MFFLSCYVCGDGNIIVRLYMFFYIGIRHISYFEVIMLVRIVKLWGYIYSFLLEVHTCHFEINVILLKEKNYYYHFIGGFIYYFILELHTSVIFVIKKKKNHYIGVIS